MEKIIEILGMLLWDALKTVVLQWLLNKLHEWWTDFSQSRKPAFA